MNTRTLTTGIDNLIRSIKAETYVGNSRTEWLSANDIARELGLHLNTVYKILQKGQLKSYNCSVDGRRNYYRIKRADLEDYLLTRYRGW